MLRRHRHGVIAIFLTIPALLCPLREADAQIQPGAYSLLELGDHYDVIGRAVGDIMVPPRQPAATSYTEQWRVSLQDLASAHVLEIKAITAGDRAEGSPYPAPMDARADEHVLDPEGTGGAELFSTVDALAPGISDHDVLYIREIWQQTSPADEFRIVGFLWASRVAAGVTLEHWLLSEEYVNPSPGNAMRTQLRPRGRATMPSVAEVVSEAATVIPVRRYIHVELRELAVSPTASLPGGEAQLACAYRSGREGDGGLRVDWLGLGLGALLVLRERRRRSCRT